MLLLLLMAAAAPSRARGSGCRSGAAVRGVSAHWLCPGGWAAGNRGSRACRSVKVGMKQRRAERDEEVKAPLEARLQSCTRAKPYDWEKARGWLGRRYLVHVIEGTGLTRHLARGRSVQ